MATSSSSPLVRRPGTISYALLRFGPDGTPRDGWPYRFAEDDECGGPLLDDAGNVIVACGSAEGSRVVAIDADGDAAWDTPLALRGANRMLRSAPTGRSSSARRSATVSRRSAPAARPLAGLAHFEMSGGAEFVTVPTGGLLAWWHEGAAQDVCHGAVRRSTRSSGRLARRSTAGRSPITAYCSTPAIGPDGSVYIVDDANHVYAFDPDGLGPGRLACPGLRYDRVLLRAADAVRGRRWNAVRHDGWWAAGWRDQRDRARRNAARWLAAEPAGRVRLPVPQLHARPASAEPRADRRGSDLRRDVCRRPGRRRPHRRARPERRGLAGLAGPDRAAEVTLELAPDGRLFAILVNPDEPSGARARVSRGSRLSRCRRFVRCRSEEPSATMRRAIGPESGRGGDAGGDWNTSHSTVTSARFDADTTVRFRRNET